MKRISIVIPVFNEAEIIGSQLERLQKLRAAGHELIVVDGGSSDNTLEIAENSADCSVSNAAGRSLQMNKGAELARGDVYLFLHADTQLPENAAQRLISALEGQERRWGWFDVRLSGTGRGLRMVERMMNLRARLSSVCTGDQAIFVESALFREIGGFPEIELMEDIAISKKLRRIAKPARPEGFATTSSRRWEDGGLVRTILLMWKLRLLYVLGIKPSRLKQLYYPRHD